MIEVDLNPCDIEDDYLRHLNLAYGHWGDRRQFDWYFRRQTTSRNPDLIALKVDGRLVAGSGVSYRKIKLPAGDEISVGVVTGAWTLPEFRNQGCFARVIAECVRVTAQRGGALLLGFVNAQNASGRQMARLGSAMFPVWYLRAKLEGSQAKASTDFAPIPVDNQLLETLFARVRAGGRGQARFSYASARDFSAQFVCRPGTTEVVLDRKGNFGIIEERADTNVLQLMLTRSQEPVGLTNALQGLRYYSHARGRELVSFTTWAVICSAARAAGFEVNDGFLTVLIADAATFRIQARIDVPNDARHLAETDSRFFLGRWSVHAGDRL